MHALALSFYSRIGPPKWKDAAAAALFEAGADPLIVTRDGETAVQLLTEEGCKPFLNLLQEMRPDLYLDLWVGQPAGQVTGEVILRRLAQSYRSDYIGMCACKTEFGGGPAYYS
jgi:hypothetical protein